MKLSNRRELGLKKLIAMRFSEIYENTYFGYTEADGFGNDYHTEKE